MEQLLTVASVMVSGGKSDVKLLNSYLKDYNELMFGTGVIKKEVNEKEDMYNQMKGFREMFRDVTFIPKIGKKLDTEFNNINLLDLIKKGKK